MDERLWRHVSKKEPKIEKSSVNTSINVSTIWRMPFRYFMDDFSIFSSSFDTCLHNLSLVLQHCKETNLILSW